MSCLESEKQNKTKLTKNLLEEAVCMLDRCSCELSNYRKIMFHLNLAIFSMGFIFLFDKPVYDGSVLDF